jgi:geranylgeranyl reductase
MSELFDAIVVGGGPAGATAAHDLARRARKVALLDRAGRIKPCGGAIPPRLIRDFEIPPHQIVARAHSARIVAPSDRYVDMPIDGGFVGMVDRDVFDEWLRSRAESAGAKRVTGLYESISRDASGIVELHFRPKGVSSTAPTERLRARAIIGADGANSAVARTAFGKAGAPRSVFAYHEVIEAPVNASGSFDVSRCDIYYRGELSPDFYAWIFPHGETVSVGVGSAKKGFALRKAVAALRRETGLENCRTLRCEGAPIPLKPRRRWDNGIDLVLAGDAAGVVAPASGEGIYYAMCGGRMAADAVHEYLVNGRSRALADARRRFMKAHGTVFWVLEVMQYFWYANDRRRERFVKMCADPDVQRLTWEAYMNKELVRAQPGAHMRIFFKDMGHLLGMKVV